ncbi:MAG: LON peptidase substrate-binding domain-containing protein [SAR324 cluster bacterium]|nr:LON peptidase substrate-binding domain-containing protein [SAR324 cluster bacterium]
MTDSSPPVIIPLFPLTGVLLLPGMLLPLHIFEPRYRAMVSGALQEGGHIGMVQPLLPRQDNRPPPGAELETPRLYPVGCAGRLEKHQETSDGRFLIQLHGVSRFRIVEELPLHEGYRRARADYSEFSADLSELEGRLDTTVLLEAFAAFTRERGVQVDWEELRRMPGPVLLNSLAMSLPYAPPEKQALLEAPGLAARAEALLALLKLGSTADPLADPAPPRTN